MSLVYQSRDFDAGFLVQGAQLVHPAHLFG